MSDAAPKKLAKPNTSGTVFDVKRPGKAPLQPTSRPVIVGHKSVVRDPLTTGKQDTPILQPQKTTISPPAQDSQPAAKPDPKPTSDAATAELAAVAAELAAQPENPKQEPASAEPVVQATVAAPAAKSETTQSDFIPGATTPIIPTEPEKKQKPLSPELKRQMEEAVSKSPAAPDPEGVVVGDDHAINFVKVFLWFLAVIALVVIVGDLLLDAGSVTTSINIPHTHFIK